MPTSTELQRELATLIRKHAKHNTETATPIASLFLSHKTSPSQALHVAQWPCLALVAQGGKRIEVGAQGFDYGVGDFLLVSLDLPVVSRVTRASVASPNLGLGLRIDPERLASVLRRMGTAPRPPAAGPSLGVAVHRASPALLDATMRLVRLLEHPGDIPALAPLCEEELLYRLLVGPCGDRLRRVARADTPMHRVSQATAWLTRHFAEPLQVGQLARRVGMSASSLHHHFKAVTQRSPLQFQKQLRLNEARRLMLVQQLDVGTTALHVGYQNPSQFSREYRRQFDRSPLHDLRLARHAAT